MVDDLRAGVCLGHYLTDPSRVKSGPAETASAGPVNVRSLPLAAITRMPESGKSGSAGGSDGAGRPAAVAGHGRASKDESPSNPFSKASLYFS
jgi:hypothetical protein